MSSSSFLIQGDLQKTNQLVTVAEGIINPAEGFLLGQDRTGNNIMCQLCLGKSTSAQILNQGFLLLMQYSCACIICRVGITGIMV